MGLFNWLKSLFSPKPKGPDPVMSPPPDTAAGALIRVAEGYIGKHENGSTNRAPWLDVIERKAGMLGEPWCAIIAFWEWIPIVEEKRGVKSSLIPSAHVRTAAKLNRAKLHKNPKAGDIGFLGRVGSSSGHLILVKSVNADGSYVTIEGNTSASDGSNTNGGEVASHIRKRGTNGGLEEIGFAAPFA